MGGQWESFDLIFPIISGSRAFRQGTGNGQWWGVVYVFLFLGAAPLVLCVSLGLELLWLPLAMCVVLVRACRRRGTATSFMCLPLSIATHFLDLDGE
jgi:hypothetical protein